MIPHFYKITMHKVFINDVTIVDDLYDVIKTSCVVEISRKGGWVDGFNLALGPKKLEELTFDLSLTFTLYILYKKARLEIKRKHVFYGPEARAPLERGAGGYAGGEKILLQHRHRPAIMNISS